MVRHSCSPVLFFFFSSYSLWFLSFLPIFFFVFLMASNHNLSLIQWNVRGLVPKSHWLKFWQFCKADIFAFQETFLKPDISFSIKNMIIYRYDRTISRGGGLLVAVRNRFSSADISNDIPPSPGVEFLAVKVRVNRTWISIVNIYSPADQVRQSWLQDLPNSLHPPFFILGDFNQNNLAWGNSINSPGSDEILNWITQSNVCFLNTNQSTHVAPSGSQSLIDLSFVSADLFVDTSAHIHQDLFS